MAQAIMHPEEIRRFASERGILIHTLLDMRQNLEVIWKRIRGH